MRGISREQIAILNHRSQMIVRRIEVKPLKELTWGDLDMFVTGLNIELDELLSLLLGVIISSAELKSVFWAYHINRSINVRKTHTEIADCSNACTLTTLQSYTKTRSIFDNIKINWCYYKLTGKELGEYYEQTIRIDG